MDVRVCMKLAEALWRKRRGRSFSRLSSSQKVIIHLKQDGRFLPFLIRSLHALGFGVAIDQTPFLYRELRCLNKVVPIPFLFASPDVLTKVGLVITDDIDYDPRPNVRRLVLNYKFFNSEELPPKMPYFIHPSASHAGLDQIEIPDLPVRRRHRIGFFGTHDPDFYRRDFHFPAMDRTSILNIFFERFGRKVVKVSGHPSTWPEGEIVIAVDEKGGDHSGKKFLSQSDYFDGLLACDFVLSPPGWCMPLSHNLVEAMMAGAIPLTNCGPWMAPALENGLNCVAFEDSAGLCDAVESVVRSTDNEVASMRDGVIKYRNENLMAGAWLGRLLSDQSHNQILVNAEECSVWTDKNERPTPAG